MCSCASSIFMFLLFTLIPHPWNLHSIGDGLPSSLCCTYKRNQGYWLFQKSQKPPLHACQGIWHVFHKQGRELLELQDHALQSCAASDSAPKKVPCCRHCKSSQSFDPKVVSILFSCGRCHHWKGILFVNTNTKVLKSSVPVSFATSRTYFGLSISMYVSHVLPQSNFVLANLLAVFITAFWFLSFVCTLHVVIDICVHLFT